MWQLYEQKRKTDIMLIKSVFDFRLCCLWLWLFELLGIVSISPRFLIVWKKGRVDGMGQWVGACGVQLLFVVVFGIAV